MRGCHRTPLPDPAIVARFAPPAASSPRTRRGCSSPRPRDPGPSSRAMVDRRVGGVPLEHVLGWAEFCGLRIAVDPGCSCPAAAPSSSSGRPSPSPWARPPRRGGSRRRRRPVLRLGRGGAALSAALDAVELHAADVDPAAVRCARRNLAAPVGACTRATSSSRCPAHCAAASTSWSPTRRTCRPPRSAMMPPEARAHEARAALDGGAGRARRPAAGRRGRRSGGSRPAAPCSSRRVRRQAPA